MFSWHPPFTLDYISGEDNRRWRNARWRLLKDTWKQEIKIRLVGKINVKRCTARVEECTENTDIEKREEERKKIRNNYSLENFYTGSYLTQKRVPRARKPAVCITVKRFLFVRLNPLLIFWYFAVRHRIGYVWFKLPWASNQKEVSRYHIESI